MDILPPKKPLRRAPVTSRTGVASGPVASSDSVASVSPGTTTPVPRPQAVVLEDINLYSETSVPTGKRRAPSCLLWATIGIVTMLLISIIIAATWYTVQQGPVDMNDTTRSRVIIKSGMGPKAIATELKKEQFIRSELGFDIYTRINGSANKLQAGSYLLSKSMSLGEIVDHLQKGSTDVFTLTFYPGATLRDNTNRDESKKTDVTTVLKRAGYTEAEISIALQKRYDHPVFSSKPDSADLEGYVYGETYEFNTSATVEQILEKTFDQLHLVITQNNLVEKFKAEGLTLYEGITLASIVQREVNGDKDQKEIAAVFYNRYKLGMNLGSDVTYQYIADKTGQQRTPDLNSPYNTRKYTGLPPGPIAAPGRAALLAAAEPSTNGYLYFLSGDDDVTYFATNEAGHEQNIRNHCQQKCQIL